MTNKEQAIYDLLWPYLKKDIEHKDRVLTSFGTKTIKGLVASIERVLEESEEVSQN